MNKLQVIDKDDNLIVSDNLIYLERFDRGYFDGFGTNLWKLERLESLEKEVSTFPAITTGN